MAATVTGAFVLLDRASGPLRSIRREAERTDASLRSMGDGMDTIGTNPQLQKMEKTSRAIRGMTSETTKASRSTRTTNRDHNFFIRTLSTFGSRIKTLTPRVRGFGKALLSALTPFGLMPSLIAAALPLIIALGGALTALASSLGAAALGVGALAVGGAGALGVGIAGLASIIVPAIGQIKSLTTAQTAYNTAIQTYGKNSAQAKTAAAQLATVQKQVGNLGGFDPKSLTRMKNRWLDLTKSGRTQFFGLIGDAQKRIGNLMPAFARSSNSSMRAARRGVDIFLRRLDSPEFRHVLARMTTSFERLAGPLARAFSNIGKVFGRIAVAVAPDVERMARDFENITEGWTRSTKNAHRLRSQVHELVSQARAWFHLTDAVFDTIVTIGREAAGPGKHGVQSMTAQFREWDHWLTKHPRDVKQFFKDALEFSGQLFDAIGPFFEQLFQISKAMKPISSGILDLTKALNSLKVGNVSALTALLGTYVGIRAASKVKGGVQTLLGSARGTTPANPVFVEDVTGGGVGKGVGGASAGTATAAGEALSTAKGAAEPGAGRFALGARFANFATRNPIGAASGIALGIQGFAAMGAPGTQNTVGNKLNAFAHGADPTRVLHLIGMPALSDLLPGIKKNPTNDAVAVMRNALGIPDIGHPLNLPKNVAFEPLDPTALRASVTEQLTQSGHFAVGSDALANAIDAKVQRILSKQSTDRVEAWADQVTGLFDQVMRKNEKLGASPPPFRNWTPKSIQKWADDTTDEFDKVMKQNRKLNASSDNSKKTISNNAAQTASNVIGSYSNMTQGVGTGLKRIQDNTNHALKALGLNKPVQFRTNEAPLGAGGVGHRAQMRTGGPVPGVGNTDTVPAILTPGEFVVRKEATAQNRALLEAINAKGYAKGGVIEQALGPYTIPPIMYDPNHAGGNSHVHADFFTVAQALAYGHKAQGMGWTVGEYTPKQGNPFNFGPITVQHQSPGHYDGTAWDANKGVVESRADVAAIARLFGSGVAAGGGTAAAEKIKRILLEGPKGPMTDTGQRSLDRSWHAANAFLKKHAPKMNTTGADVAVGAGALSKGELRKVMRAAGLPSIFGWIAEAESGRDPMAHNASGASGLWQIMMPLHQALVNQAGGNVFNPNTNARVAKMLYSDSGLSPWAASQAGWGPHQGQPYRKGGIADPAWGGWWGRGGSATVQKPTLIGIGDGPGEETFTVRHGRGGGNESNVILKAADQIIVQGGNPDEVRREVERGLLTAARKLRDMPEVHPDESM